MCEPIWSSTNQGAKNRPAVINTAKRIIILKMHEWPRYRSRGHCYQLVRHTQIEFKEALENEAYHSNA